MMKRFVFILIICISNQVFSQSLFNRIYYRDSLDWPSAVVEGSDGNFLIVGSSKPDVMGWDENLKMLMVNSLGDPIWDKNIGVGSNTEQAQGVIQTLDSNYIVAGNNSCDPYLLKISATGTVLWQKTYPLLSCSPAYSVKETFDGGFVFTAGDWSSTIFKTDSDGDTVWTTVIGYFESRSIIQSLDSGYVLCGRRYSPQGDSGIYVIKLDANGDSLWAKTYGGNANDLGLSIEQEPNGDIVIAGVLIGQFPGLYETCIIKINSNGDSLWTSKFNLGYPQHLLKCQNHSGYILTSHDQDDDDLYISKLDNNGIVEWTSMFYGTFNSRSNNNVDETQDGGYVFTAHNFSATVNSKPNFWLVKLDSAGNYVLSTPDIASMAESTVQVYPIPASDMLHFKTILPNTLIQAIRIYDSKGVEVYSRLNSSASLINLNISQFPEGLYHYRIDTEHNLVQTGKIVLTR